MNRYLLDTNIFVGIVRDAAWAISTLEELRACSSSSMFFTSVVCQGELYSLAEQRGWGRDRRADLEKALNQCFILDINKQQIIHAYALLDAWTKGKPVEHQNIPLPPKPAKKCRTTIFGLQQLLMLVGLPWYLQIKTSIILIIVGLSSFT